MADSIDTIASLISLALFTVADIQDQLNARQQFFLGHWLRQKANRASADCLRAGLLIRVTSHYDRGNSVDACSSTLHELKTGQPTQSYVCNETCCAVQPAAEKKLFSRRICLRI